MFTKFFPEVPTVDVNANSTLYNSGFSFLCVSYAPWCPACKGLQSTWKDFAAWSPELGIKVGQVDVTTSPGLSGRFMVTALPTIFQYVT